VLLRRVVCVCMLPPFTPPPRILSTVKLSPSVNSVDNATASTERDACLRRMELDRWQWLAENVRVQSCTRVVCARTSSFTQRAQRIGSAHSVSEINAKQVELDKILIKLFTAACKVVLSW
jgi:hypothetical protein